MSYLEITSELTQEFLNVYDDMLAALKGRKIDSINKLITPIEDLLKLNDPTTDLTLIRTAYGSEDLEVGLYIFTNLEYKYQVIEAQVKSLLETGFKHYKAYYKNTLVAEYLKTKKRKIVEEAYLVLLSGKSFTKKGKELMTLTIDDEGIYVLQYGAVIYRAEDNLVVKALILKLLK